MRENTYELNVSYYSICKFPLKKTALTFQILFKKVLIVGLRPDLFIDEIPVDEMKIEDYFVMK